MNFSTSFLLSDDEIIVTGDSDGASVSMNGEEVTTETQTSTGTTESQSTSSESGGGLMSIVLIWVAMGLIFYFLILRPQKKRDKKAKEERAAIEVGDTVITTSGMYGKIVGITEEAFMVEFGANKNIIIPMSKTEIVRKAEMPK